MGKKPTGGPRGAPASFKAKLRSLVDDENSAVMWTSDGRGFTFGTTEVLEAALPAYFNHNSRKSFLRQLHAHGFRIMQGRDGYQHPFFTKGSPADMALIVRVKQKRGAESASGTKKRKERGGDEESEPNGDGRASPSTSSEYRSNLKSIGAKKLKGQQHEGTPQQQEEKEEAKEPQRQQEQQQQPQQQQEVQEEGGEEMEDEEKEINNAALTLTTSISRGGDVFRRAVSVAPTVYPLQLASGEGIDRHQNHSHGHSHDRQSSSHHLVPNKTLQQQQQDRVLRRESPPRVREDESFTQSSAQASALRPSIYSHDDDGDDGVSGSTCALAVVPLHESSNEEPPTFVVPLAPARGDVCGGGGKVGSGNSVDGGGDDRGSCDAIEDDDDDDDAADSDGGGQTVGRSDDTYRWMDTRKGVMTPDQFLDWFGECLAKFPKREAASLCRKDFEGDWSIEVCVRCSNETGAVDDSLRSG